MITPLICVITDIISRITKSYPITGWNLKECQYPQSFRYFIRPIKGIASYSVTARSLFMALVSTELRNMVVNPDPTVGILRAFRDFFRRRNIPFAIGLIETDKAVEDMCREEQTNCFSLFTDLRLNEFGRHWNQEGHKWVHQQIFAQYEALNLINGSDVLKKSRANSNHDSVAIISP